MRYTLSSWPTPAKVGVGLVALFLTFIFAGKVFSPLTEHPNLWLATAVLVVAMIVAWQMLEGLLRIGAIATLLLVAMVVLTYYQADYLFAGGESTPTGEGSGMQEWLKINWNGAPLWFIAVVATTAIAAVIFGDKRKFLSLVASSIMIIFAIIVFYSYRDGWLYEDQWRHGFYVIVIAFSLLAFTFAKTDKEKSGATLVLGAIFIMLGVSQLWHYQEVIALWPFGKPSTNRMVELDNPQCTKTWGLVNLTSTTPTQINEKGFCKTRIKHPGKCIYLKRPAWTNDSAWYGPYCDKEGSTQVAPDYVEWAKSTEGSFQALVQLNP